MKSEFKTPVESGLTEIYRLQKKHGFKTVIFVWPLFEKITVEDTLLYNTVLDLAKPYGFPVFRLAPHFIADSQKIYPDGTPLERKKNLRFIYTTGDKIHPNPYGSSVAADAIVQTLNKIHLLDL